MKNPAIERRRKVFTVLVSFCAVTLVLGLLPGLHWLLWVHVLADLCLAAMVGLLISLRADAPAGYRRPVAGAAESVYPRAGVSSSGRREAAYLSSHSGTFEPAGHGYRLVSEAVENPLVYGPPRTDPPSIKVYRADDPPSSRLSSRPGAATERMAGEDSQLIRVVRPGMTSAPKPRMFIEDEDEFLQAQGL